MKILSIIRVRLDCGGDTGDATNNNLPSISLNTLILNEHAQTGQLSKLILLVKLKTVMGSMDYKLDMVASPHRMHLLGFSPPLQWVSLSISIDYPK
jgi:hypothetical protein